MSTFCGLILESLPPTPGSRGRPPALAGPIHARGNMINPGLGRTFGALTPLALVLCAASSSALGQGTTCATATPVFNSNNYSGDTTLGTVYTNAGITCGTSNGNKAQWFRYLATGTGNVTFDTCATASTTSDTVLSIHSDCTTNSTNVLNCNDDFCGNNGYKSSITQAVVSGTTYYIRVSNFGSGGPTAGPFAFAVGAVVIPPPPPPPPPPPTLGPDVTVYTCTDIKRYETPTVRAFAVGTTSYNPPATGDYPVDWRDGPGASNKAPVIAQNIYKLKNGRFIQLGQSWLKHGFASTNSDPSASNPCIDPPLGGNQLGINCLDTYGSGLNGNQTYLGARSFVNPTTGYFAPVINGQFSPSDDSARTAIAKHAQCPFEDVELSGGGVSYFAEGYYVTYDDAIWGNSLNNASYAPMLITSLTNTTSPSSFPTPTVGVTQRQSNAIRAWGASDASVVTVNADHVYTLIDAGTTGDLQDPGTHYTVLPTLPRNITCRYIVACKVTNNGNGTWHYEYCVYNHNSDRSAYSFSLRLPYGAVTTGEGMYFPRSHSGEPYTNNAWTADKSQAGMLTFKADADFATNPNANAIRWGTMYTFWFDANVPPMSGQGKVTLFKPAYQGTDASNAAAAPSGRTGNDLALWAFANGLQVPRYCPADIAQSGGDLGPDGLTSVDDLVAFLAQFFAGNIAVADLATLGGGAGSAGDGQLTVDDLVYFLAAFFSNCN